MGQVIDALIAFLNARLDEKEAEHDEMHYDGCARCGPVVFPCDCGYPARVLREVEADRAVLNRLERAVRYRDQVFAQPEPRSVSDEMRAVTTMLTLESVVRLRAAVHSDHPDYQEGWATALGAL